MEQINEQKAVYLMAIGKLMSEIYAKAQQLTPENVRLKSELAAMSRELREGWMAAGIERSDITIDTISNLENVFSPQIPWTEQILDAVKSFFNAVTDVVFSELTGWLDSNISRRLAERLLEFCAVSAPSNSSNVFFGDLDRKASFLFGEPRKGKIRFPYELYRKISDAFFTRGNGSPGLCVQAFRAAGIQ